MLIDIDIRLLGWMGVRRTFLHGAGQLSLAYLWLRRFLWFQLVPICVTFWAALMWTAMNWTEASKQRYSRNSRNCLGKYGTGRVMLLSLVCETMSRANTVEVNGLGVLKIVTKDGWKITGFENDIFFRYFIIWHDMNFLTFKHTCLHWIKRRW